MATIGNTGTPNQTFAYYGTNSSNVMAIQVTMPSAGLITAITGYFKGHGASINAQLCVWNSSGTLLANSGTVAVGSGSGGVSGQGFQTGSVSLTVTNGQVLRIGWWRQANQSDEWTEQNAGTEYQATQASNSGASNVTFSSTGGTPSIYATYTAYSTPNSIGFSPSGGPAGTSVAITGASFTGTTAVAFNGTAASYTLNSDSSITATAPSGFSTGTISITNAAGTGTSGSNFLLYVVPSSIGFSPGAGPAGTSVAITGSGFTGATAVAFNGTGASFTLNSDTSITATAPAGVTVGPISVTNSAGTGSSASNFIPSLIYADDGAAFQTAIVYADDGANWQLATVWADNGTAWVQVG